MSVNGTCMLHTAIARDKNVIKKGVEKILNYKVLTTEIQSMWNIKTKVTPVKIRANWKAQYKVQQNTAILGTVHILRKALP